MKNSPIRIITGLLVVILGLSIVGSISAAAIVTQTPTSTVNSSVIPIGSGRISGNTPDFSLPSESALPPQPIVFTGDQSRTVPHPDDEVQLIVLLADEPLAAYLDRAGSRAQPLSADTLTAIQRYADRLAAAHQSVLSQLAQRNVQVTVKREFSYLINGLALSTRRRHIADLQGLPQVKAVQLDGEVHADLNDSVPLIGAPQVWALHDDTGHNVNGQGLRVAVIDTGIDYTHPDLGNGLGSGHKVIGGYDFVNNDTDPMDDNGHGTHVAGIVAANGGVVGVAPGANLLAYKALDAGGSGSWSNVIAAIERAVDPDGNPATHDGADVINLSLSGPGNPDDALSLAVDQAVAQGVVVVVAAGNDGANYETLGTPASARQALTVAASDKSDGLADFSSRGPIRGYLGLLKPDLTAPGVSIRSTVPLNGEWGDASRYNTLSGTSMAAPHVAGAAALIKQLHPTWTPDMIKANLMNTAKDLGQNAYVQGAGRVQAFVAATTPLIAVPGSLSFGQPLMGGATSAQLTVSNLSMMTLTATASISTVLWDNGTLSRSTTAVPVTYTQLSEANISIPAGGTHIITVSLSLPDGAPDGYYTGQIVLRGANDTVTIPLAFTLLSRVTVHVLDETGTEWLDPWSYGVQLYRVPAVDVQKNNWGLYAAPVSFMIPAGQYQLYANARLYWYTPLLENWGPSPWKPLILATTVTITQNSDTAVYLDARTARHFTLDTTTFAGDPLFAHQLDAGYRYQVGGGTYSTMFGFAYADNAVTDLHAPLPATLDLYISDTPPGTRFDIGFGGFGFSPHLQHFNDFNSAKWARYADPQVPAGLAYRQWADEVHFFAWQFPTIDATTPTTLAYSRNEVGHYRMTYNLPGTLPYSPTYDGGFHSGFDTLSFMPHGLFPFAEPAIAGVQRDVFYRGAFYYQLWANGNYQISTRTFSDQDLPPLPPVDETFQFGGGPLYPAITFANDASTIRFQPPVLGSPGNNGAIWSGAWPWLSIDRNGTPVYTGYVDYFQLPTTDWTLSLADPGPYHWLMELPSAAQVSSDNRVEAGFTLASTGADMNPPRVLAFDMPQRYAQGQSLTATLIITDAESGVDQVQLRYSLDDGQSWTPAPVTLTGTQYYVSLPAGDAPGITLNYTATDNAGNYLAFTTHRAAIQETPTQLALNVAPWWVPLESHPVTLTISGTLRTDANQPLSNVGLPIAIYLNDQLAGYVRDITHRPNGTVEYGTIQFDLTFVPTDFFTTTGLAKLKFVFDVGTYARQEKVIDLWVGEIQHVYLPLIQSTNDLIVNGGFETEQAWIFEGEPSMGAYTSVAHSGQRGLKLGILSQNTAARFALSQCSAPLFAQGQRTHNLPMRLGAPRIEVQLALSIAQDMRVVSTPLEVPCQVIQPFQGVARQSFTLDERSLFK